jgi:Peptidase MA superfamily
MRRKIALALLSLAIGASLLIGLSPRTTIAGDAISVTSSTATPQFPTSLTFTLSASSGSSITDIRLDYTVERDSFVHVVTEERPSFTPGTITTAVYNWNMLQSGGLPTGTVIDYWWIIRDSSGTSLTTAQQKIAFDDSRFAWHDLAEGNITLYWYSGTTAFAQTLMDTAVNGLSGLEASTGASLSRPVTIYIYDNATDMQGAMVYAQDWTGGATYPAYSTIIIGINSSNLTWGEGAMVHELTHMVNYQMTNNPYSGLPTWLDEGLAMYSEGPLDSSFQVSLVGALSQNKLFTVRSMASPFSTDATLSYQEYAESYSLVDYLISTYGESKMAALLDTFKQGSTYDGALTAVYGFDMDGLYQKWVPFAMQKYLGKTVTGAAA